MIEIKVISPSGTIYEGEVSRAVFPGEVGLFEVLPMHAPLISTLVKGNILCYPANGEEKTIPIESGFVEVKTNVITACVESK